MTDVHADMRDLSEGRRGSLIDARPWLTKAKTVVAVGMVLSAASMSLARDSGPPRSISKNVAEGIWTPCARSSPPVTCRGWTRAWPMSEPRGNNS